MGDGFIPEGFLWAPVGWVNALRLAMKTSIQLSMRSASFAILDMPRAVPACRNQEAWMQCDSRFPAIAEIS